MLLPTLPVVGSTLVKVNTAVRRRMTGCLFQEEVRGSYADSLVLGASVHILARCQLKRMRTAITHLQAAASSVHVRDLSMQLAKCVAVSLSIEQTLHRLMQVKALATVLDAVDAVCMQAAAVVALAEGCALTLTCFRDVVAPLWHSDVLRALQ